MIVSELIARLKRNANVKKNVSVRKLKDVERIVISGKMAMTLLIMALVDAGVKDNLDILEEN